MLKQAGIDAGEWRRGGTCCRARDASLKWQVQWLNDWYMWHNYCALSGPVNICRDRQWPRPHDLVTIASV